MNRTGIFRATVTAFNSSSGEAKLIAPQLYGASQFDAHPAIANLASLPTINLGDTVWVFFPDGEDTYPYWFSM